MKKLTIENILIVGCISICIFLSSGCLKDFLEAKPTTQIVAPTTLSDFQQLLDNTSNIDRTSSLGQISCDEYYFKDESSFLAALTPERNAYVWNKNLLTGQVAIGSWNIPYTTVFYANSAIAGMNTLKVPQADQVNYNDILGQAYFMRAFYFFDLVKNFSPPYDDATASTDLGIPLKLMPNVDQNVKRSSVQQTYNQIIADLNQACRLLSPALPTQNQNRGSKPAAYALFARMYLSMRKYSQAELYADSSLALYNTLIDYNSISKTSSQPFTRTNAESLNFSYYAADYSVAMYNSPSNISIDTALLSLYDNNDLRKTIFFITNSAGLVKTKRGYSAYPAPFSGLATDEVYLIKAECATRRMNNQIAVQYLNTLLSKRFKTGTYIPVSASGANLLSIILQERRKELVWRAGLRWDDLRRLNKEGANITLTRNLNGVMYNLPPNSPLYTFPIPDDEIALSGIQQNIR